MKKYMLTIATITIIWQPTCIGMLSNTTKPTLEYLLSTAAISNDICKNTFKDTTKPVQNDVITKYLLVKHVMKDNGLHSLSINTPHFSATKPIASYDCDSRMWGSGSLHNTIPAFHSCGKNRKLRTPDHQHRECNADHENSQKKDDPIDFMKLHADLPQIVALDTFISSEHVRYY